MNQQIEQLREICVPVSVEDELPKESGLYICELEKKEDGVRTEIASFMEYRTVYGEFHDNNDGFKVKTWLKKIKLPHQEVYVPVPDNCYADMDDHVYLSDFNGAIIGLAKKITLKGLFFNTMNRITTDKRSVATEAQSIDSPCLQNQNQN